MRVTIESDAEIVREANQILVEHLSPAKMVRLWASWQMGAGDYLAWRREEFGQTTVDELYEAIEAFQTEEEPSAE